MRERTGWIRIWIVLGMSCAALGAGPVEHVVMIGIDGLSVDGMKRASHPHLDQLMRRGAFSLDARSVIPTDSTTNWASILNGAGPAQHGMLSNKWKPNQYVIEPTARTAGGMFPSVFSILKEQRPGAASAVFHQWKEFDRLVEPGTFQRMEHRPNMAQTAQAAATYLKDKKPTLLFVQLDEVDHAGHQKGWTSEEYYAQVTEADKLVGLMLDSVKDAGIMDRTVIVVVSDHGGVDRTHGGSTMAEVVVPWIIAGPGIAVGRELKEPVNGFDTAPTVAKLLGLRVPGCWIARPVDEALVSDKPKK